MFFLHSGVKGLVKRHEDLKAAITTDVNLLVAQIHQALAHLTKDPSSPVTSSVPVFHVAAPRLSPPKEFSGESGEWRSFIVDCEMHYVHLPSDFPTEWSKVAFMISHLTGRARAWATAEWSRDSSICGSLDEFKPALRRALNPLLSDREKARELSNIKQGITALKDLISGEIQKYTSLCICHISNMFPGIYGKI